MNFWDKEYKEQLRTIPLFKKQISQHWSALQKQKFAKVFYHLRGHFSEFLWLMGNFAPNIETKNVILKNISEEFGEARLSHEQLYFDFSVALQADIQQEIVTEENYTEFARKFNKGHIQWLLEHSWNEKQAAFSAYERLDNIDYPHLLRLATSFNLPKKALLFFEVHTKVEHFDVTEPFLKAIWDKDPQSIFNGFSFIYSHQLKMWHNLSNTINQLSVSLTEGETH